MFGRLKDHKLDFPMRPIVAKCQGPLYFLEKAYVDFLKDLLPESEFVIKSTGDFINRVKSLKLKNNSILASLDIISLFPSIDTNEISKDIFRIIDNSNIYDDQMKITLKEGLNIIVKNNYFVFDGVFYQQLMGAPMGSPISGILAEFKLRPLEKLILETIEKVPSFWLRYVDDIFIIWDYSIKDLELFLEKINEIDPNIKFTLELEKNGSLSFLDVKVFKKEDKLLRDVFRKPIASTATIPSNAPIPLHYKKAAYNFLVNRAFEVCSEEFIEKEISLIRTIAIKNGFSLKFINRIINNIKNKPLKNSPSCMEKKFVKIVYFEGYFERLQAKLKLFKVQLIAISPSKLKNLICTQIDPLTTDMKAGVYQIPFMKEDGNTEFYIGMTTRKFGVRKKEHIADIKFSRQSTALARLNQKENINISFNESVVLFQSSNFMPLVVRETIEVILRKHEVCNDNTSFNLPAIWIETLERAKTSQL